MLLTGIVPRESDSLFTYKESDLTFTPIFTQNFTNPEFQSEDKMICGSDVAC